MQLFLKPFYSVGDVDAPADSTKVWQCTVLSFAAHAFFLYIAVFCMPVSALHQKDMPKEEIIIVTMESLPFDCSMGSASETGNQSMASVTAPPAPPPESKVAESSKPAKRTVSPVKPKPVRIKPPEPVTAFQNQPETALSPGSLTQAAIAQENPPVEIGTASSNAEISGSGTGLSEKGNHSEGGAGSLHGQGSGTGSGMGLGSVESAFGSAGGPQFIQRALPRFPRRAQVLGKEGTVVLRLSLDHTGRLSHVEIVSGAGNGFDEEAIRAIQKSTFSPAVRNGRPVNCLALLSVRFQLKSKE